MKAFHLLATSTGLAVLLASAAAQAAGGDATPIGQYGDWSAAYFMDGGRKVCYMASAPKSTRSSMHLKNRDASFLFITHWPQDREKTAVTVSAGFPYRKGSKVSITVDGTDFTMETGANVRKNADADMAWMTDGAGDERLTDALRRGSAVTVRGTSGRGNVITDTYSLHGSADAYDAISKACDF
ncbi:MAG: hypothetical protein GC185_08590 [Alphaproteobacteria bacterium]|nr:hypothetical protein [Alphaproteobacteria bacterium]